MIDMEQLFEDTKHFPRISPIGLMRKTKLSFEQCQQLKDELLELRFEKGIIEDTRKLKQWTKKKKTSL